MNKNCTDIKQSKKLVKILPIESADFHFSANQSPQGYLEKPIWGNPEYANYNALPCWSLAALVDVLPRFIEFNGDKYYLRFMKEYVEYANDELFIITGRCLHTIGNDNLVDACVEMIIKLKKEKLL